MSAMAAVELKDQLLERLRSGRATTGELARELKVSDQRVSLILATLERLGRVGFDRRRLWFAKGKKAPIPWPLPQG